ncbi:MAG: glyoxylate/hydroxypyruvate reductase A [Hyphomicrobiales bacterium]|nr:glyoxylate/hydroxypyruvate reductase A [Hyphomicrobiales bacterium]
MKSGLLIDVKFDGYGKYQSFQKQMPDRRIINWSDEKNRPSDLSNINYAIGWHPDKGLFASMPDLKVMFSIGAGVDHMLQDPTLPDLPLVRFVDASLTSRMSEWICLQCLLHLRQQPSYDRLQAQRIWRELPQPDASDLRVGIMGMGVLGQDAASKLIALGFQVNGWSRTRKDLAAVNCFEGSELDAFLAQTDILVGLLPFTQETSGIFNSELFTRLSQSSALGGPIFINAGRGKSQLESDVVLALQSGALRGVSLDVFEEEPLSRESLLWNMDNVIITPHVASVSDIDALALHIGNQIERFESGLKLQCLVDKRAGY